jgi:hypothetical protein
MGADMTAELSRPGGVSPTPPPELLQNCIYTHLHPSTPAASRKSFVFKGDVDGEANEDKYEPLAGVLLHSETLSLRHSCPEKQGFHLHHLHLHLDGFTRSRNSRNPAAAGGSRPLP